MADHYKTYQTNILMTGASGYVGRALVAKFDKKSLHTIDRVYGDYISQNSIKFICNDLNNLSSYEKDFLNGYMGTVIHLAAARSDDYDKEKYIHDNIEATKALLNELTPDRIKMFIHVGSVAAIDGEILEKNGSDIVSSDDWYRISKYQQQKLIESWAKRNNVLLIILAPSAIHDTNAKTHMTNIGRLEKFVTFLKIVPEINVLKSLTSMASLLEAIRYFASTRMEDMHHKKRDMIQRYLVLDKPIMTITEICKEKFNARFVIKIPKLKTLLFFLATIVEVLHLARKVPLSKDRVIKLFKSTDYNNISGYKDWSNEKI